MAADAVIRRMGKTQTVSGDRDSPEKRAQGTKLAGENGDNRSGKEFK